MSEHAYLQLGGFNPADYDLPVDARLTLHKSEMLSVGLYGNKYTGRLLDGTYISLPKIYFCVCFETNKIYTFNVDNEYLSGEFGRFREIKGKGGTDVTPNPPEPATDVLQSIKIEEKVYEISDPLIQPGELPPTAETTGKVGQLYIDKSTPGLYQCASLDNSILQEDPGTPLPLSFGTSWENIRTEGVSKILSNGGKPTRDTIGVKGQLYVDISKCELYICKGQQSEKEYIWEHTNKPGFELVLNNISYLPSKVLTADGIWVEPENLEQKKFYDAVAFIIDDDKEAEIISGLLSEPRTKMFENKLGYTLVSNSVINIKRKR